MHNPVMGLLTSKTGGAAETGRADEPLDKEIQHILTEYRIESYDELVSHEFTEQDFDYLVRTGFLTDHQCHVIKTAVDKHRKNAFSFPVRSRRRAEGPLKVRDFSSSDDDDQCHILETDVDKRRGAAVSSSVRSRRRAEGPLKVRDFSSSNDDDQCHILETDVDKRRGAEVSSSVRSRRRAEGPLKVRDFSSSDDDDQCHILKTDLDKRRGAEVSSSVRSRLRFDGPPRLRDLSSADDDDQLQLALHLSELTVDEELQKWGEADEPLEQEIVQVLMDQGIKSLDDLVSREFTERDFQDFVYTGLLTDHQCQALKAAVERRRGAAVSLPVRSRLRVDGPPRLRDLSSADDDDQLQLALHLSELTVDEELQKWGEADEPLEQEIVQVLMDQGIKSLDDLVSREFTERDFQDFVYTGLLTDHQCQALKAAVERRRGAAVSLPVRSRLRVDGPPRLRDLSSADDDDQLQLALHLSELTVDEELQKWGEADEPLEQEIVQVLMDQGIKSLDDLVSREFTERDFQDFVYTGLLTDHQCQALKAAVERRRGAAVSLPVRSRHETDAHPQQRDHFTADGGDQEEQLQHPSQMCHATGGVSPRAMPAKRKKDNVYRFLLVGKTGGGKSTTGNSILGKKVFHADITFSSVTSNCQRKVGNRNGRNFEILDCPGLFDTEKTNDEVGATVVQAVAGMHPGPHAILYVVRLGRFTAEEFGTYQRLKCIFNENITKHMIIVFTCGDELEREEKSVEELFCQNTPKELQQIIKECDRRYTVFNNMATDTWPQVECLLSMVDRMMAQNKGQPFICPKYAFVGEHLEKEVARRLEKVEKEDIKRKKYVQQLERRTREAEKNVRKINEQHEKNERERQRKMKEEAQKYQHEDERLAQMMAMEFFMETQRREEIEKMQRMKEERRKLSQQLLEEQTERRKRYEQEMEKVKEETAKGKGKLFLSLSGAGALLVGGALIGLCMAGPAGAVAGLGGAKLLVEKLPIF